MNPSQNEQTSPKKPACYARTPYTNLVRSVSSGDYIARIRIAGKLIRRSLKTNVLSVAKLRLADMEQQERQLAESTRNAEAGKLTFEQLAKIHLERVKGDRSLKLRTKFYHEERAKAFFKSGSLMFSVGD